MFNLFFDFRGKFEDYPLLSQSSLNHGTGIFFRDIYKNNQPIDVCRQIYCCHMDAMKKKCFCHLQY